MGTLGSAVFVGRVRELDELDRALDATRAGAGATVLIAGEAGIGKTRLASEVAARADERGFEVLLGRSIDLVGTELPYQPFLEALRPLGTLPQVDPGAVGSQLRMFQDTLALLSHHTAAAPVLLVLEDVHWADTSTLDLFLFLAYNLGEHPLLLLATCRSDEQASAERMGRLLAAIRRSGSGLVLELDPLDREELRALLAAHAAAPPSAALSEAILARCDGNPFFAEELLTAAGDDGQVRELPRGLRELLLQRVARLDAATRSLLRLAAAAGRDVGYGLLRALAGRPERELRDSLREAVEHGVLVAVEATGRFRFRHALLAEAVYSTILPGEREELHARLAEELARDGAASPAELAPHWAAAGRRPEALAASVEAARQAQGVFALPEALGHLERALALWCEVPEAAELAELDLAELCNWAAGLANETGAAPRAVELARRAIDLVGDEDPPRAAALHVQLAVCVYATGDNDAGLAAVRRAVELVPEEPPSGERAQALSMLGTALHLAWRHEESLGICEQALALARAVGERAAEARALTTLGSNLAYLGRAEDGLAQLRLALARAEENGEPMARERAYVGLTDVLTMLGRPREAARVGRQGLATMSRYGVDNTVLFSNQIEALIAIGEWDEADTLSAAAVRALVARYPYMLLIIRADLETGRGHFEAARQHLEAASITLRQDRGLGVYDAYLAELALWERRYTDADEAVTRGLAQAGSREAAQIRVQLCAKGLRAQAELAALARARRDPGAVHGRLSRARTLIASGRTAAAAASAITPNANGWLAQAEAEYQRTRGGATSELWRDAAATWDGLERPPFAAYCRWRQAEALVASGASRVDASAPLRAAYAVAARIKAMPLLRELESLAERARLDLAAPAVQSPEETEGLEEMLGLTAREAEVLKLIARGYTNREIAAALVISVKTASVHVSHILQKLDAPNRREAAAIAHRLAPVAGGQAHR